MFKFQSYFKTLEGVFKSDSLGIRRLNISARNFVERTILYDFHVANEGKIVDFAGFEMPVQYGKVGISVSHKHVRQKCGLFDVSHMLQTKVHGKDRVNFMESLVVGDIEGLHDDNGILTLFTNDNGGIIDDLICSKTHLSYLYVVSNAGCKDKDLQHMQDRLCEFKSKGGDAELEVIGDHGLLALQGPFMMNVLQPLVEDANLSKLYFMNTTECKVAGIPCRVTRCGYTGEDGVEISVPNNKAVGLSETLLGSVHVQLAGLGARDSLRLEAGLCLYGNDIDETTTPIEAGLAWTIGKRRRQLANFPGAEIILQQLKDKPLRRRVGLVSQGPPPRSHCPIIDNDGNTVGEVTSGVPSPSLGVNIAMGYVPASLAKAGTQVNVQVRSKQVPATVTKMPFLKCSYYSPK